MGADHHRVDAFHRYKSNKNYRSGAKAERMRSGSGVVTFCKAKSGVFVSFCNILIFQQINLFSPI